MSLDSLPSDVSEDFSQLNLKVSPYKFASNILIEQDGKVYINSSSHSPSSFHKRTLQVKIKDPETKRRINLSKELDLNFVNPFFPPKVHSYGNSRKFIRESPTADEDKKIESYDYQTFLKNRIESFDNDFSLPYNPPKLMTNIFPKAEENKDLISSEQVQIKKLEDISLIYLDHINEYCSSGGIKCSENNKSLMKTKRNQHLNDSSLEERSLFKTYSSIQEELSKSAISPCETFVNQSWKEKFNPSRKQENNSLILEKDEYHLNNTLEFSQNINKYQSEKIRIENQQFNKIQEIEKKGNILYSKKEENTKGVFVRSNLRKNRNDLSNANKENKTLNLSVSATEAKNSKLLKKEQNLNKPKREILGESKIHLNTENLPSENKSISFQSSVSLNSRRNQGEKENCLEKIKRKERISLKTNGNESVSIYKKFKHFSDYQQSCKENKKLSLSKNNDIEAEKRKSIGKTQNLISSYDCQLGTLKMMKKTNPKFKNLRLTQHNNFDSVDSQEEQHFQSPCLITNKSSQRMDSTQILEETQIDNSQRHIPRSEIYLCAKDPNIAFQENENLDHDNFVKHNYHDNSMANKLRELISQKNKNILEKMLSKEELNKKTNKLMFCENKILKNTNKPTNNQSNNDSINFSSIDENKEISKPLYFNPFSKTSKERTIDNIIIQADKNKSFDEFHSKENGDDFYFTKSLDDIKIFDENFIKQKDKNAQNSSFEFQSSRPKEFVKKKTKSEVRFSNFISQNTVQTENQSIRMKKTDSRSKSLDLKRLNDTQFGRQINEKFLHQNQMTSKTKGLPLDKNKPNLFLKSFYSSIRPIYETKRMKNSISDLKKLISQTSQNYTIIEK